MFGGSSEEFSKNESYNVLRITSILCGYVIWISYNAALTSELMITEKSYPFVDLESLSSTSWRYGIHNLLTSSKVLRINETLLDCILLHQEFIGLFLKIVKMANTTMSS